MNRTLKLYELTLLVDLAEPKDCQENIPGVFDVRIYACGTYLLMISFGSSENNKLGQIWWQIEPSSANMEEIMRFRKFQGSCEDRLRTLARTILPRST
jgi:hypothetical protein